MGDAKMVNMLATSFSWYFLKFYTLKMCDQHFARFLSFSVHSWIALLYFFSLSNGSEINCYLRISCDTVNSPLTNTSLRRTTPGVGPCHCPVIWLNYALYKGGNLSKGLFTWSGGPRSSGVSFFCFHALGDTKQKKLTPLDRGPLLHVNRV